LKQKQGKSGKNLMMTKANAYPVKAIMAGMVWIRNQL